MLQIFKSTDSEPVTLYQVEEGAWINLVSPGKQETLYISKNQNNPAEYFKAALDAEERFRLLYPEMFLCVQISRTVQYLIQ